MSGRKEKIQARLREKWGLKHLEAKKDGEDARKSLKELGFGPKDLSVQRHLAYFLDVSCPIPKYIPPSLGLEVGKTSILALFRVRKSREKTLEVSYLSVFFRLEGLCA